jgi:L-fuculose-phosphate aldolase
MPAMDLPTAAAAIVASGRRLGARGLVSAGEGNLSVLLDDERLAITPSGRRKDELDLDDIVVVPLGGPDRSARSASGLAPSSDLAIHLAVHAARPDVTAVAHAHLPASMALTLAGEIPDPTLLPETALFIPRLPFLGYGTPGSDELASRIASALSEPPEPFASVVLLERHGAVAVGPDPGVAVDRLELVEVLCAAWRDSLLLRAARATLSPGGSPGPGSSPLD